MGTSNGKRNHQSANDPIAVLYVRSAGIVYRFKVYPLHLWIERQPGGDNLAFDRFEPNDTLAGLVYNPDTGIWDLEAIGRMIELYAEL